MAYTYDHVVVYVKFASARAVANINDHGNVVVTFVNILVGVVNNDAPVVDVLELNIDFLSVFLMLTWRLLPTECLMTLKATTFIPLPLVSALSSTISPWSST